ncbi:MAG: phosphate acyltransferase, partial [Syntrophales bacterium]|nr:phosphate acyltransferase [Syntrophales bacterium]
ASMGTGTYELVAEPDPAQVLLKAVAMVRNGDAQILLEGKGHEASFLAAVQDKERGLAAKGGLVGYVSLFPLLKREKLILVTDTYINNYPSLAEKQQLLAGALRLARLLGVEEPKVAVLTAIEQVNPAIPSSVDAAALAKMGERGQFGRAIVEGPIDIDCALSRAAAERKGLRSVVTGNVDIYLVPEIDTGRLLAEALVFFGRMRMIGAVVGTTRPVVLNLPLVTRQDRVAEVALAVLMAGKEEKHA